MCLSEGENKAISVAEKLEELSIKDKKTTKVEEKKEEEKEKTEEEKKEVEEK